MKKLRNFIKEYKHFTIAMVVAAIALVLDILGSKNHGLRTDAHILLGVETLVMAAILLKGMIQDLRDGTYGVDLLAVTAIVTSVILHEYWTAMITVLMLTGGEALENYAESRAKSELTALLSSAPKKARVIRGRKVVEVKINEVRVGDKVVIQPGELVPVDCIITDGSSSFDESSLTGESMPVDKKVNDELLSGSINTEGVITARALRIAEDSQFEQILKIVKNASNSQSPFVKLADRYSIPFTIVSFLIAIGAWVYSGDVSRFLKVLVVATPCPLLLGAPIGMISGMSRAAKHGIIVKNGASLEKLANINTIAFDKTGTLTFGKPTVSKVIAFSKHSQSEVLALAASLEQNSQHVLAQAVVNEAAANKVQVIKARGQLEIPGKGLTGLVGKTTARVGRISYLVSEKITKPSDFVEVKDSTATYVANSTEIIGCIVFEDELRPESKSMLESIKKSGIKNIIMLTGDNQSVAKKIGDKLGITNIIASCMPADKVKAIADIKENGRPVAFVGDGVNDAPVLTTSDVGIALGARGSAAASESADVVIMLDNIGKVAEARDIAKNTFKITRQSILMGIGMSFVLMIIFASGKFKPVYGAAIQELVDVSVILSALRAHGPFKIVK